MFCCWCYIHRIVTYRKQCTRSFVVVLNNVYVISTQMLFVLGHFNTHAAVVVANSITFLLLPNYIEGQWRHAHRDSISACAFLQKEITERNWQYLFVM